MSVYGVAACSAMSPDPALRPGPPYRRCPPPAGRVANLYVLMHSAALVFYQAAQDLGAGAVLLSSRPPASVPPAAQPGDRTFLLDAAR